MTSPTATARPWATPVRAPRRDPAKKRGHGPGRRVPVCATHPPKAGSVAQISVSTRHFGQILRQRPTSAPRQGIRPSTRVVDPERPVRGGEAPGGGQRRRGGDQPVERTSSQPRGPTRGRAHRCRRHLQLPQGEGVLQDRLHGDGRGTVSSGRTDSVCNPAIRAATVGRHPGAVRRRAVREAGMPPAAARVDETLGVPGKRRLLRNRSPELGRCPTAGVGARPPGLVPDRYPCYGERWWERLLRLAVGRDAPWQPFDAGGAPLDGRENRTRRLAVSHWTNGRNRTRRLVRELGRGRRRR